MPRSRIPIRRASLTPPGQLAGRYDLPRLGRGHHYPRTDSNPEMYSWNLSIQREIGWNSILEVNYTGSRGVQLYAPYTSLSPLDSAVLAGPERDVHPPPATSGSAPIPSIGIITDPKATNLNGTTIQQYRLFRNMPQYRRRQRRGTECGRLHLPTPCRSKWEKRFSKGLTHARALHLVEDDRRRVVRFRQPDWLGGTHAASRTRSITNWRRALSQNDVPHRFVATADWQIPFGHGRHLAPTSNRAGGWHHRRLGS